MSQAPHAQPGVRTDLDEVMRPAIVPVCVLVAGALLALVLATPAVPGLRAHPVLVVPWLVSAVAVIALATLWRQGRLARLGVGQVAAAVMGIAIVDGGILAFVTRVPSMTGALVLIAMGIGLLFSDTALAAVGIALCLLAWGAAAVHAGFGRDWVGSGITLLGASGLAMTAQVLRVKGTRHLQELREKDQERRAADLQLDRARAEAEFKAGFLELAAHELATPLTPLILRSRMLLLADDGLDPRRTAGLLALGRSADRLQAIVQDMLTVVRFEAGVLPLERQEVDLAEVAAKAVADLAEAAASRQQAVVLDAKPTVGSFDTVRIGEAVRKLVDNALRFSPPGSQVDVSVETQGDEAVVTVADRGMGLPAELVAHLHRPLSVGPEALLKSHAGAGLGLPLARIAVLAHGGSLVHVERQDGGSILAMRVPLRPPGVAALHA